MSVCVFDPTNLGLAISILRVCVYVYVYVCDKVYAWQRPSQLGMEN